jgi:hypothetical protein
MYRLFARAEPENDTVIDLTEESVGETKEDGVTDLTGDVYFEKQIGLLCTVHSINNAIGRKLIHKDLIVENEVGIQDRINSEGRCIMYNMEEMALTVCKLSNLKVTTLNTLFETPEQTLTFAILKSWGVANIIQNILVMWTRPYFHRVALRYVDSKWWLLDSEENQPIEISSENFDEKMSNRRAELSLQVINTIVPKSTILYFDITHDENTPIII